MQIALTLHCDAKQVLLDLALLAEFAKRSDQVRVRLLDFGDLSAHICCVDADPGFAAAANELGVCFQLSDPLLELVAAVRAGKFDGLVVEDV